MQRPRHFSMLRDFHLADWFTLANAFCGTGAVFAAMRFLQEGGVRDLLVGMALIPLAFLFDALDGRVVVVFGAVGQQLQRAQGAVRGTADDVGEAVALEQDDARRTREPRRRKGAGGKGRKGGGGSASRGRR